MRAKQKALAPAPSTLTPPLPLDLSSSIAGVPSFFIESFQIPPFLLPIFQAAGTAYGVPWQVLAAINEVETDYGRDLSVSSAGAEGWMQFLPSEWAQYGVDANGDGWKDPYNPADAIFAAARYLRAAGGDTDIKAAVYSYNHSQAYVESVMLRAQLLGGTPSELLGAITGLTEARFPVYAASHFSDGFPTVSRRRSGAGKDARRNDDLLAGGGARDRRAGRRSRAGRRLALARALRRAARRLRQHLRVRAARRSRFGVPGARAARPHSRQRAHRGRGREPSEGRTGAGRARHGGRAAAFAAVRRRRHLRAGARRGGGLEAQPARVDAGRAVLRRAAGEPKPRGAACASFSEGANEVYLHPLRPRRSGDRGDRARSRRRRRAAAGGGTGEGDARTSSSRSGPPAWARR